MALQGVLTGSMNPRLAPNVAPRAGMTGSIPAARATSMTTGTMIWALAVFEVASETKTAIVVPKTSIAKSLEIGMW